MTCQTPFLNESRKALFHIFEETRVASEVDERNPFFIRAGFHRQRKHHRQFFFCFDMHAICQKLTVALVRARKDSCGAYRFDLTREAAHR